jgi:hypothetical protein
VIPAKRVMVNDAVQQHADEGRQKPIPSTRAPSSMHDIAVAPPVHKSIAVA